MEEYVYTMTKYGWNPSRGEYCNEEKIVDCLTLKQVQARVKRLPDTTAWLWSISKYVIDKSACGGRSHVESISADEFDGDVPDMRNIA
jgi:hypothetical protein